MNVLQILDRYKVEYVESGRNVAKGNVNVQCPWCGEEDHSQHLGINVATGMWGCWRDSRHRGRQLYRLLSKLTGLSLQEARRATGEGVRRAVQLGDMERAVEGLQIAPRADTDNSPSDISLESRFRALYHSDAPVAAAIRFRRYLTRDRKFQSNSIQLLCRRFDLHYAVSGDFADRIIIPVYEDRKLMTWLGRSIYKDAALRYRALEKEKSVKQVKDCIYNYDRAKRGGKKLVIVEGPADVWKIDIYNKRKELCSVGLFNMNVEETQLELLYDLRDIFDEYILLLDRGETAKALSLESQLYFFRNIKSRFLMSAKDPGALSPRQSKALRDWL